MWKKAIGEGAAEGKKFAGTRNHLVLSSSSKLLVRQYRETGMNFL
jgi:hypothetical protein